MSDDLSHLPRSGGGSGSGGDSPGPKDIWDKIRAAGMVVVALVIGFGGWLFKEWQADQDRRSAEARFYTDLMAQREQADSDIRAKMFNTLFDAYFGGQLAPDSLASAAPGGSEPAAPSVGRHNTLTLQDIHDRIMFLDLLARNFDGIDIRPLFEDLNRYLTDIWSGERVNAAIDQEQAFKEREILRRAAHGVVERQTAYLQSIDGARVQTVRIVQHPCDTEPRVIPDDSDIPAVSPDPSHMEDGVVSIVLQLTHRDYDTSFDVSFFDMPIVENIQLPNGDRLAITLDKYFSPSEYEGFGDLVENPKMRKDYELTDGSQLCRMSVLNFIYFPDIYIGPRDRPLIHNLINTTLDNVNKTAAQ